MCQDASENEQAILIDHLILSIPFEWFAKVSLELMDDAIDEMMDVEGVTSVWFNHCCGAEFWPESNDMAGIAKEVEIASASLKAVLDKYISKSGEKHESDG
jgi:KaiC/GvpD/RAD55 family RecA-like ATPase